MKELFHEGSFESIIHAYSNYDIPLKVRKLELFQTFELPLPEIIRIKRSESKNLKNEVRRLLSQRESPIIIRFACIPDTLSMPVVTIDHNTGDDFEKEINVVNDFLKEYPSIQVLLVQRRVTQERIPLMISGRIAFMSTSLFPKEQIMELYKGAHSINILNNVLPSDPRYYRFEKHAGRFLQPSTSADHTYEMISREDIKNISRLMVQYEDTLKMMSEVIARSVGKKTDEITFVFEFIYNQGRFFFTDIDY